MEDETAQETFLSANILGIKGKRLWRPFFPEIKAISLSQIPHGPQMVPAINFDILESLTLRMCPGWANFLERILERDIRVKLRTLELLIPDDEMLFAEEATVFGLLHAFEGLEAFFIMHPGPVPPLSMWTLLASQHRPTLKKFVHHQRTINLNDESPGFEEEMDLRDLALLDDEYRIMMQKIGSSPFALLDLEFMGLSYDPDTRLVRYLAKRCTSTSPTSD